MTSSTESFKISKALLEEVRKVAKATDRSIQRTIEIWIREGLAKYTTNQENNNE